MSSKLRLLLISPHFFPYNRYEQELMTTLVKLHPEVEVTVLCYNTTGGPEKDRFSNLEIRRIPYVNILPGQFALANFLALVKTLRSIKRETGVDLLCCDTRFFDSTWWTPIIGWFWKKPAVFTDHCAYHPRYKSWVVRSFARLIDEVVARLILPRFSVLTTTSLAAKNFLKTMGVEGITVLRAGVDSVFFNPSKRSDNERKLPGIDHVFYPTDIILSTAGRIIPTKGFIDLYSVIRPILSETENVYFAVGGEGPDLSRLKSLIHKDKLGKKVFLSGYLDKGQMSHFLGNSDIFVYPSRHHEGFPNIVLEAAASGCVVVTTPMGGTTELVEDNQTGLILDPNNFGGWGAMIRNLIKDHVLQNRLKSNLLQKARKEFTWEKTAEDFYKLITKVCPLPE